jgi:ABC-type transport system involved in cytochrome c biogenesis permease subunit
MVYIAFLSLAVAIVASIMYIRLRRRVKRLLSEGVFLGIGPKEREALKEITYRRFAIVHNMYEMLFLTCGNILPCHC